MELSSSLTARTLYALPAVGIVAALIWHILVYPLFISPLASVPVAHPLARFTSLWIQWQRFRGRDFEVTTAALQKYGPYVRLGPNELAMQSKEDMNHVYGVGKHNFDKHPSYDAFITHGFVHSVAKYYVAQYTDRSSRILGRETYSQPSLKNTLYPGVASHPSTLENMFKKTSMCAPSSKP